LEVGRVEARGHRVKRGESRESQARLADEGGHMKTDPDTFEARRLAMRLKLRDGVGFLVRLLSTRATLLYHELTGQEEITPRQFGAMLTLFQCGEMTLTELAAHISIDRATLSEMMRRMAERGLIRRSDNDADRRSAKVSLAPRGGQLLMTLVEGAAKLQTGLLAPLSPEDRRHFLRCMKIVAEAGEPTKPGDASS
jgi:DNA-binding MarR family transcriptional regulator